jgi:hypothetical protein
LDESTSRQVQSISDEYLSLVFIPEARWVWLDFSTFYVIGLPI